jgi:hypothetical protein
VGNQGAHATRLGERECVAVGDLTELAVEQVGMGRDVAEEVQGWAASPG